MVNNLVFFNFKQFFQDSFFNSKIKLGEVVLSISWIDMIFKFIFPLLAIIFFYRFLKGRAIKHFPIGEKRTTKEVVIYQILHYLLLFTTIFGIGTLAWFVMKDELNDWLKGFFKLFQLEFHMGGDDGVSLSLAKLLLLIPVFYIASFSGKAVRKMLDSSFLERLGVEETKRLSVGNLVRYVVMIFVFLVCLNMFLGINLSALSGVLVTLGIGIGFGVQNIIGNFFSGITILFTHPIKEKDQILVDGYEGEVIQIRLLSTVVKTLKNENIIIPNSKITNNSVYNYTYNNREVLIKNPIGVSYHADLEKVIEVLIEIAKANPYCDKHFTPIVRVVKFSSSSIDLALITKVPFVQKKYDAHSWTNLEIWRRFKSENIRIPFPQVDIHLKEKDFSSGIESVESLTEKME